MDIVRINETRTTERGKKWERREYKERKDASTITAQ